jgi:hypothetical protein
VLPGKQATSETEPLDMGSQARTGNADPLALPPVFYSFSANFTTRYPKQGFLSGRGCSGLVFAKKPGL